MVKCPYCGSTSQPKTSGKVYVSENGRYFVEYYTCGCGCYFEALYPREEVETTFAHYVKDIEG